jgi:hypothetical protein
MTPPAEQIPSGPITPPQAQAAAAAAQSSQPLIAPSAKKKSKLPLILGIVAVVLVLFVGAAAAAGYFFVIKPRQEARAAERAVTTEPVRPSQPTTTTATPAEATNPSNEPPPYTPPADAVEFVNSKDTLDGKLLDHYVDFSFYYPNTWKKDPTAGVSGASNFAKVERLIPPDFTQENFAVGWYSSSGAPTANESVYKGLADSLSKQLEGGFPEYRKVSEGPTHAGVYDGYEFRFEAMSRNTAKGDIKIWGRVIFIPPPRGGNTGVTLLMLATSLAPELQSVDDVGVKGDLPMVLESFRFGK